MPNSLPALAQGLASLAEVNPPEGRLLRAAFDALPAHLRLLDEQGQLLLVNRAWRQFAADNGGDERAVAEGSNYLAALGDGADAGFGAQLRDVLSGRREACELDYPCHSPTVERWFTAVATRVHGDGLVRAVVAHQPITARRRAEIEQRTQHKMQALGTMASGIAHDFNNVLAAILGQAQMAVQDLHHPAAMQDHLALITQAGLRARDLVQQILAFSRGQTLQPATRAVAPLLHEALALVQAGLPPGVQLRRQISSEPLHLHTGESDLVQVLLNLCSNAWQAMAGRPGVITVALARAGPRQLQLQVADDGPGIPEAVRERIFEPFFTTKPVGQGTGLGLAVVHGIVMRHGGSISLHSRPGQGTRFTILLPLAEPVSAEPVAVEAVAVAAADARAAGEPAAATAPATGSVLLVDDDEVVGLTTEALLLRAGFTVQRLRHPADALQALRDREPPDVLLSDYSMPEFSGLELVRQARALHPRLCCAVMSGYIDDRLVAQQGRLVDALIHKEEAFDTLVPTLQRLLQACRAGTADQVSRVQPASSQA